MPPFVRVRIALYLGGETRVTDREEDRGGPSIHRSAGYERGLRRARAVIPSKCWL